VSISNHVVSHQRTTCHIHRCRKLKHHRYVYLYVYVYVYAYAYAYVHVYVVSAAHRCQQDMSQFLACSIVMGIDIFIISLVDLRFFIYCIGKVV
jgi:hypothetical protein